MKTLLEMITIEMKEAFKAAGYDEELARVTLSNRPDLCEYQCNGAMAGAKKYKKAPIMIANAVVEELADSKYFASAEAVITRFSVFQFYNLAISEEWSFALSAGKDKSSCSFCLSAHFGYCIVRECDHRYLNVDAGHR